MASKSERMYSKAPKIGAKKEAAKEGDSPKPKAEGTAKDAKGADEKPAASTPGAGPEPDPMAGTSATMERQSRELGDMHKAHGEEMADMHGRHAKQHAALRKRHMDEAKAGMSEATAEAGGAPQ